MKTIFTSFLSAVVLIALMIAASPETTEMEAMVGGEAEEEGFGLDPGSRKYYEYLRLRQPDGSIPAYMSRAVAEFASRLPVRDGERSLNWQNRGPVNKGGRTRAFAIDKTNENILIAGSVTGGMWRSTDAGASWVKTTTPGQLHSSSCVVQDPRPGHEQTWYQGTGEEFYGVVSGTSFTSLFSGDGIFKSTDGGQSWNILPSTSSNTPENIQQSGSYDFVWNMVVDHTNLTEDVVYAAVYNGVIRSNDGGTSWQQVLGFWSSESQFGDIMMTPSGVLYATFSSNSVNGGGVWRSDDGITWTKISPVISGLRRIVMTYNPQNENEVFFLGEVFQNSSYPIGHMLYKYTYISGDGTGAGGTWENRSSNLPNDSCSLFIGVDFEFGIYRSQNSYDICIAHHPQLPVLFIGGINIDRSSSEFAVYDHKWIGGYRCNTQNPFNYSYPNHHSDQHYFVFKPSDPNVMYNVNDGGIYRTDNCLADSVSWVPLNHGYVTTQFYTVAMEQGFASSDWVMGGMQDNGSWLTTSSDASQNWKEVHADDGSFCAIPEGRNFIVASSQQGKMLKKLVATDGSLLGTERFDPLNGPTYLFINPFILDPLNHRDVFMAGNKSIWYYPHVDEIAVTNNYGTKRDSGWIQIGASNIPVTAGSISCLDKAKTDNTIVYYGTTAGRVYRLNNCYGATPVRYNLTDASWEPGGYISCITANDLNVAEVICSFSNYGRKSIFHSIDSGSTWVNVSGNLEQFADGTGNGPAVYWVEIYPSDPQIYFAATSAGLYSTNALDGENTIWQMEGASSIGNVVVDMVVARPYDGKIAVGTHGNGIYTGSLTPVEAAAISERTQTGDALKAWPNPFKSYIQIPISTANRTNVRLDIYDLSGNLVYSKKIQSHSPQPITVNWAPDAGLAEGTYVYVVQSEDGSTSGKIIYQR